MILLLIITIIIIATFQIKHRWAVEFITKNSLYAIKYLDFYDHDNMTLAVQRV